MAISSDGPEPTPERVGNDQPDSSDQGTVTDDAADGEPDSTTATGIEHRDRPESFGDYARQYAADHVVHLAVVALFAVYPFIYGAMVGIEASVLGVPLGDVFTVALPRIRTMIAVFYIGLFAMSFDFISGYTGYLSFGHAMFYGTGAYLVILAANGRLPVVGPETSYMTLLIAAAMLGGLVALAVGAVSFRLTGVYFAMVTLGFAELGHVFIRNWGGVSDNPRDGAAVTSPDGFAMGVPGIDSLQVEIGRLVGDSFENLFGLGIELSSAEVSYYAIGVVVLLCYFAMQRIVHSPFGRVMVAIRENEERARAVGFDTFWYKLGAFGISGAFAGVAGGLFAGYRRSVAPENSFDLFVTADALLAAIIGGFGTIAGSLFGHLFHASLEGVLTTESHGLARFLREHLPEGLLTADVAGVALLDVINILIDGRAELYLGLIFILFVLFVPRGILGSLRDRLGGTVAATLPDHVRRYLR